MSESRIDSEFRIGNQQIRQIEILNSIDKSLSDSLGYDKNSYPIFARSEILLKSIAQSTAKTVTTIASFYRGLNQGNEQEYKNFLNRASRNARQTLSGLESELSKVIDNTEERVRAQQGRENEGNEENNRRQSKREDDLHSKRMQLLSEALRYASKIGAVADNFSETSNRLLQITGEYKSSVQSTRREIVNIVDDVNKQTGNFFNAQESYKKMTDIASAANIGDLDVLEEITKPVLLASEGMEASTESIAKLLGRWNTRYNFSSLAMEDLLDEIRGNTAGNNASAEATLKNLEELDNWMAYYSKGDEDKLKGMSEAVSKGTSWLESMGVDTSRYTGYLKDIASGDALTNSQLIQVLNSSGISGQQAQRMFSDGRIDELYEALFLGESSILESLDGVNVLAQALESREMNVNDMLDSYTAYKSKNYIGLDEFTPLESTNASVTDDKYLGPLEAIQNKLSGIASFLSTLQENTGGLLSFSTFSSVIAGSLAMKGLFDLVVKAFPAISTSLSKLPLIGSLLGGSTSTIASGGILAAVSSFALPIAAVAGALAVGGTIYAAIKEVNKTNEENFKELIDVTNDKSKGKDELMMMTKTASVDEKTGKIKYSYNMSMVDASQFNQEEHLANLEANRKEQDKFENKGILRTIGEIFTGSSANKNYVMQKGWTDFFNSLGIEDRDIVSAYTNAGLITKDSQREFMQNNFSKIKSLHDLGIVVNLNGNIDDPNNQFSRKEIFGYAVGSNYISSNQLAYLHEGEAVVPRKYNPMANITELEMLREQSKDTQQRQAKERAETLNYMKETAGVISEIKEFLAYWRDDNIKRENIDKASNRFAARSEYLAHYLTGEGAY